MDNSSIPDAGHNGRFKHAALMVEVGIDEGLDMHQTIDQEVARELQARTFSRVCEDLIRACAHFQPDDADAKEAAAAATSCISELIDRQLWKSRGARYTPITLSKSNQYYFSKKFPRIIYFSRNEK